MEYVELSSGHSAVELLVPDDWVGKTLQQLSIPAEKGVNIIAIKFTTLSITEEGENVIRNEINDMPGANDIINEGDVMVLIGPKIKIDELIEEISKKG
jgi:trk system potassium uptake protein TrkA